MVQDDPLVTDRMSFYKSELARISAKRVVPNVTIRAREFETRSSEPRKDNIGTVLRKSNRDSRSLDNSGKIV